VKSNDKIDVSKFQSFLTPYGIENAKGKIALNVEINEKTEKGYINFENISLESTKAKLKLTNFNGPISFNGRNIKIEDIKASLNNSPLDIDGFVDFTDFASLPKDDLIRTLPYKFHFKIIKVTATKIELVKLKVTE